MKNVKCEKCGEIISIPDVMEKEFDEMKKKNPELRILCVPCIRKAVKENSL